MDTSTPNMTTLFAQLGLADDEQSIATFIREHRPIPMTTRLWDAPFWTPSQSNFIREKLAADCDWAVIVDTLNAQLRDHPAPAQSDESTGASPELVAVPY